MQEYTVLMQAILLLLSAHLFLYSHPVDADEVHLVWSMNVPSLSSGNFSLPPSKLPLRTLPHSLRSRLLVFCTAECSQGKSLTLQEWLRQLGRASRLSLCTSCPSRREAAHNCVDDKSSADYMLASELSSDECEYDYRQLALGGLSGHIT